MTNAWALLYDELMTEHSSHYYEYDRNDPNRENPFEGNEIDLNLDALTKNGFWQYEDCLLYTSPSPRDVEESRMPSSA